MSGIFLRWGVPGFVTVVGGTALSIMMTGENIASDLNSRASEALATPEFGWASVTFEARDAVISGTATNQQMIDAAVSRVAAVHGVRAVSSEVVLAEFVSPFPFGARLDGSGIALSGGVPDEAAHAAILVRTAAARDGLRLMSGAPERAAWNAAVDFGLSHLEQFDQGEIKLVDLQLSISGRAKSPEAYDALLDLGRAAPAGVAIADLQIAPALASPFEWRASFDGRLVTVSGHAPTEAFAERVQKADLGGIPVSTSLLLASGAPQEFDRNALLMLENLVRLEQGTGVISDASVSLVGAPPNQETAAEVKLAMTPTRAVVRLDPPRIAEYELTAIRSGGVIALDGFVPDAATLDRLEGLDHVDAASLELARGAPDRFDSAVDFALAALERMSEGTSAIRGTVISLSGRATTIADFIALQTTVALGAPQGLILGRVDIRPPLADPFLWSAEKGSDGKVAMVGFVPSQKVRETLLAAIPRLGVDTSTLADGNPADFESVAQAALGVLALLDTGKVAFDGEVWSVSGSVDTAQEGVAAEAAFTAARLGGPDWTYDVTLPDAVASAALPVVDPYVWQARKAADGRITLGGYVPAEAARKFLAGRVGEGVVDNLELGAGAPEGFVPDALAGLEALVLLEEGTIGYAAGAWSVSGETRTAAERLKIEEMLKASADTSGWQITIQARDAAAVATPYVWSATKAADGSVSLSGYVMSEELKRFAAVRAGTVARDTTAIASGEPEGFVADVLAGLDALAYLDMGTVKYENGKWVLAGVPETAGDGEAALAALSTGTGAGAGWETALSAPTAKPEPEARLEPVEPAIAAEPAAEPGSGLEVATAPEPSATPEPAAEPAVRNFIFVATKSLDAPVALAGQVPADATRRWFGVIAGEVPTDALTLGGQFPPDFIPNADAGIRTLAMLSDGQFGLDGDKWVLSGRAASEAEQTAALANLDVLPSKQAWEINVTQLPEIDVCRQKVGAFASRNAILFQSGSARMTEASAPALDELAGYLSICPEATVHVEGHTDADGADDLNLVLSVARAEAVVNALIARGVRSERLYAIGYGEGLPIADNDTRAGKQANRRIVFTVLDEHQ